MSTDVKETETQSDPYLTVPVFKNHINRLIDENTIRLRLLRDVYAKVYSILNVNNINCNILRDMTFVGVSNGHFTYEIVERKIAFCIEVIILNFHTPPAINFTVRNTHSNVNTHQQFSCYDDKNKLDGKFIFFFTNHFSRYYCA
jgi:hypothetical protein